MTKNKSDKKTKHYGQICVGVFALVLVFAVAAAVLLTGGDIQHTFANNPENYTASGRVVVDGENFAGVSVSVNGVFVSYTDEYGVFTVRELKRGDKISFSANGYSFSPNNFVIAKTRYDYKITASKY